MMVQRNLMIEKVADGRKSKRSGTLTIQVASLSFHFPSASPPPRSSSSIKMNEQHANAQADAIAVCKSFLARFSSLLDAMIDMVDDIDIDAAGNDDPQNFSSNDVYRTTFTTVVTEAYDARSWHHYTIIWQYRDLLYRSVCRDFSLLHTPADACFQATVERWGGSLDAVEALWPFEVPRKTGAGDVASVCREMWAALRAVAAAGLREEARVGLCEFDAVAEGGVARRVVVMECVAEGLGARLADWVGRRLGVKLKRD